MRLGMKWYVRVDLTVQNFQAIHLLIDAFFSLHSSQRQLWRFSPRSLTKNLSTRFKGRVIAHVLEGYPVT